MAKPSTRAELKDYCLRKLGAPVLQINVADEQVEDAIDDTFQFFQERHFDGMEKMYLKHELTQAEVDRFKETNVTHTSADGTDWTERKSFLLR